MVFEISVMGGSGGGDSGEGRGGGNGERGGEASMVQMDAMKKLVLVQLILYGQVSSLYRGLLLPL